MLQYISANFVGLAFIPFTLSIFFLVHLRNKAYFLNDWFHNVELWADTQHKKYFIVLLFFGIAIAWSFIIGLIVFPFSDVDEAMTAGIKGFFLKGINPYTNNIVPHILLSSDGEQLVYGTYNYGPIDLLIYGIGYIVFSPFFGDVWWLFMSNIVLLGLVYLCISISYSEISDQVKIIPFMLLMGWFMQDNAVLMSLFLSLAWLVQKKSKSKYKHHLVTFLLTLGVFTKLYLTFVVIGYFVYVFKNEYRLWIENILVGGLTSLLIMIPFDILAVINSIFLFHSDLDYRENFATIQGGLPAFLEIIGLRWLFIPLAIICVGTILFYSNNYAKDDLELKLTINTIFFLFLLPSSVFAFFIIPVYFMLAQYYENIISS